MTISPVNLLFVIRKQSLGINNFVEECKKLASSDSKRDLDKVISALILLTIIELNYLIDPGIGYSEEDIKNEYSDIIEGYFFKDNHYYLTFDECKSFLKSELTTSIDFNNGKIKLSFKINEIIENLIQTSNYPKITSLFIVFRYSALQKIFDINSEIFNEIHLDFIPEFFTKYVLNGNLIGFNNETLNIKHKDRLVKKIHLGFGILKNIIEPVNEVNWVKKQNLCDEFIRQISKYAKSSLLNLEDYISFQLMFHFSNTMIKSGKVEYLLNIDYSNDVIRLGLYEAILSTHDMNQFSSNEVEIKEFLISTYNYYFNGYTLQDISKLLFLDITLHYSVSLKLKSNINIDEKIGFDVKELHFKSKNVKREEIGTLNDIENIWFLMRQKFAIVVNSNKLYSRDPMDIYVEL